MSKWRIVPQVKKVDGEEVECEVKEVRFALTVDKKTKEEKFIALKNSVIRVLFKHEREQAWEQWKVTYSFKTNAFNLTCPDRKVRKGTNPLSTEYEIVKGNRFRKGSNTSGSLPKDGIIQELKAINVDDAMIAYILELIACEAIDAMIRAEEAAAKKAAKKTNKAA